MIMVSKLDFESELEYSIDRVREVTDRIVVVLVGQPRGTTLKTWKRYLSDVMKSTIYPYPEDDHCNDPNAKLTGENWAKGCPVKHKPIIDIVCVVSEYDTPDRYMQGEDPRLAGLDVDPYYDPLAIINKHSANDYVMDLYNSKKFPINKNKWEKHQREVWDWADSVNFVYWTDDKILNRMEEKFHYRPWHTRWVNQFLHFSSAVQELPEIFDNLTKNSVVIRQRYDTALASDYSLWHYAKELFSVWWTPHGDTDQHYTHHAGFDLSPIVSLHDMHILRGHLNAGDVLNTFDGPGAQIFGAGLEDWLLEHDNRVYGGTIDPIDRWSIPEMIVPKFCVDNGYTFNMGSKLPPMLLSLNEPPIADQWRYHWYDGWTPELVEEMRIQCNLA